MFLLSRRSLLVAGSAVFLAACADSADDPSALEVVRGVPELGILAEAVQAAELGSTLGGDGPVTLFAPTDTAFAALLTELGLAKSQLLADKALLTAVLKYHVLSSKV
jgi:uncharacterized surface protein with fasciclin (FAS1) repeats